jgi:hypothetical protein
VSSGGSTSGGAMSGGAASGGSLIGGTSSGGSNVGGSPSGGAASGGSLIGGGPATGGTASGGDGSGGAVSEPATVMNASGTVTFTWGDKALVVDGPTGARIVSFKSGTSEMLVPASTNASNTDFANNYGSTFWTSPQSDWSWPPVAAMDSEAYTVAVDAPTASATFTSGNCVIGSKTVTLEKKVSVDSARDVVTVDYTLSAVGAAVTMAPWEITRVKKGGITFFMTGTREFTPMGKTALDLTDMSGASWFQHADATAEGKQSADAGEGWIAHADPMTKLLLIKAFENIAEDDTEPDSGEVEIYASPPASGTLVPYVEVENQGKLGTIQSGMSSKYTVYWMLRSIPDTASVAVGSADLLELVDAEVTAAGL